jgi:sigma-B regulation protein RsbU (phosphoserine phosphatase)
MYNKKGAEGFTPDDQRLLSIIAAQSAQVVENARLRDKENELLRIQHEMKLASDIQKKLLPSSAPDVPGYEIAGRSKQHYLVGGDFFDFIPCGDHSLMICLGDVIGKGLPASLLMSNVNAILKTQASQDPSPAAALSVANTMLFNSTAVDKFVTLVALRLDPEAHSLQYANAGHTKPILLDSAGSLSRLEERGIMLGLTEKFSFTPGQLPMNSGDMLVIYSDGITEGTNLAGEEFGEEALCRLLTDLRNLPAAQLIDHVFAAVESYIDTSKEQDDMTLVVVRRT